MRDVIRESTPQQTRPRLPAEDCILTTLDSTIDDSAPEL